jgi:hypothetical protein
VKRKILSINNNASAYLHPEYSVEAVKPTHTCPWWLLHFDHILKATLDSGNYFD